MSDATNRTETWAALLSREEGQTQEQGTRDPVLEQSTKWQGHREDDGGTKEEETKGTVQEPIPEGSGPEQNNTQTMDEQEPPEQHTGGENEDVMAVEAQMIDLTVEENKGAGTNGEHQLDAATSTHKQERKERVSLKSEREETKLEPVTQGTYGDDF